jgi:glycosyltransferase involved in cell wall biosynthesis
LTRLLVIGTGPLLGEGVTFFSGQCLRTWHLTKPLLEAGHEIHLVTLPIDDRGYAAGDPVWAEESHEGLPYRRAATNRLDLLMPVLQRHLADTRPDALVGINPWPASVACRLASDLPLWADMNGYAPAEGQTRGRVHGEDSALAHFWEMEWRVARRADKISTVTRRQGDATLGELAMAGRLNRHTFDHPFVEFIPNAVAEHFADFIKPPPHLRGKAIAPTDFIILWCGGFNTWTDVDLLHDALTRVMAQCPDVHFVATGGPIAGHDEKTFARFRALCRDSPHAKRRHLLGWVESGVVDALLGEADLGINIDSPNWETHFGARNRLISMMACGLPVLTTLGTEISEDLAAADVALTVPMRDPIALTERLISVRENPRELSALAARGREFVRRAYSVEVTTEPLVAWAAQPGAAPNQGRRAGDNPLEGRFEFLEPEMIESLLRDRRDLHAIREKWLWRTAKRLRSMVRPSRRDL